MLLYGYFLCAFLGFSQRLAQMEISTRNEQKIRNQQTNKRNRLLEEHSIRNMDPCFFGIQRILTIK